MFSRVLTISTLASTLILATLVCSSPAFARPSAARCKKLWRGSKGEKVLRCSYRGGPRRTRSLRGKRYIYNVGHCWNYDVVVQQSCGCRKFKKASICCWSKNKKNCPDFRVGSSAVVACNKYGAPKYGSSGKRPSAACKAKTKVRAHQEMCKDPKAHSIAFGYCKYSLKVKCDTKEHLRLLQSEKCGPPVEKCTGCKLLESCSSPGGLKCYKKSLRKGKWTS